MNDLKMKDGQLTARFSFPADFIGFQGHFPTMPVLPGICMIQAFLVMYTSHIEQNVCLRNILAAKFSGVITVGQTCLFSMTESPGKNPDEHRLTGTIVREGEQVASITLLVSREDAYAS
jgi:3-hydroxymyristoyl/3-hydroxydecanoyl-(acyl carrier protein) dehydratase